MAPSSSFFSHTHQTREIEDYIQMMHRGGRFKNTAPSGTRREQGKIVSLRESFGFIQCAFPKDDDLFFHFSEVAPSPQKLEIGLEVEFDFHEKQNKAFRVDVLEEQGSIQWEVPCERYTDDNNNGEAVKVVGVVQKTSFGRMSKNVALLLDLTEVDEKEKVSSDAVFKGEELVYFTRDSLKKDSKQQPLDKGDIIMFEVWEERRSGQLFAKDIDLVTSYRDYIMDITEPLLLEKDDAVVEQGVVMELKDDYGLIKSVARNSPIHFQYCDIIDLPDDQDSMGLSIGQEVEFTVVTEERSYHDLRLDSRRRDFSGPRLLQKVGSTEIAAARKIKFLPKGTVEFYRIVCDNVEGTLSKMPSLTSKVKNGTLELENPINDGDDHTISEVQISSEVFPFIQDQAKSSQVNGGPGPAIKEGDKFRFSIVKEISTGYYQVSGCSTQTLSKLTPIQLMSFSSMGRSFGTIITIKENFGFINCVDTDDDVFFHFDDVLPLERQPTLSSKVIEKGNKKENMTDLLRAGMEVSFDLEASPPKGNRGGESLKGARLLVLPKGSVEYKIILGENMKGTISKSFHKSCLLSLDSSIKPFTHDLQYPFYGFLLDSLVGGERESVSFPPTLCNAHCNAIIAMANQRKLEVHIDESTARVYSRVKLTISKRNEEDKDSYKKDKPRPLKDIKEVQFDKKSLQNSKDDLPDKGDICTFDLVYRRDRKDIFVTNCKVVEKAVNVVGQGRGFVSDFVPAKNFGFVNLYDTETDTIQRLFFHAKDMVEPSKPSSKNNKKKGRCYIHKGDELEFDIVDKSGKLVAINLKALPTGTLDPVHRLGKNVCQGYVLMEPSHTNIDTGFDKDGKILLIADPKNVFAKNQDVTEKKESTRSDDVIKKIPTSACSAEENAEGKESQPLIEGGTAVLRIQDHLKTHIPYRNSSIESSLAKQRSEPPRRGDLVSFIKGNGQGKKGKIAKNIDIVQKAACEFIKGTVKEIDETTSLVKFVNDDSNETKSFALTEVVSCDPKLLKVDDKVEAIKFNGSIYGVSRQVDLYLETKVEHSKERPRLNLSLKKTPGGQKLVTHTQAKGPEKGNNGFADGWTHRKSIYIVEKTLPANNAENVTDNVKIEAVSEEAQDTSEAQEAHEEIHQQEILCDNSTEQEIEIVD